MSNRIPVISKSGQYTVTLEMCRGLVFIHCDIHAKWTPSIKRQLVSDFNQFLQLSDDQTLFTLSAVDDLKHHKFLKLFGFTYVDKVPCDGALTRVLYKLRSINNGY